MSYCNKPSRCQVPVTLILLVVYTCYLLLGAAVFWALESEAEQDLTHNFQHEKWELLKNHTCMDNQTLEMFIAFIIQAYKQGSTLLGNGSSLETWSFLGSVFFSVTVITTIGYGNLSPSTVGGRVFCIFFALFGIPLNLILLNRIGRRMLGLVQRSADLLGRKVGRKRSVKFFCCSCAVGVGFVLFFLLPPVLFRGMEGWTYEEGFYFAFITLSTIGFGDYVIGRNPEIKYPNWYRDLVSLWILFGMAWLALIISLCISLLENSRDVCLCCRRKEGEKKDHEPIDVTLSGLPPSPPQEAEDSDSTASTGKAEALDSEQKHLE